ncbi:MAG: His-Xaa-Ser system radical SAM maturase HxsC [Alphaproteobacteria bacterium]|jgi:His-Xaa-Ser system radical SAM maturase HxsC|nr:His-Xaa-Ser system radical SAM maturase HxsC [Alphaproteobacteria bacterium]
MLTLNSRNVVLEGLAKGQRSMVLRLRQGGPEPLSLEQNEALFMQSGAAVGPGQTVLALERNANAAAHASGRIIVPDEFDYLGDGDVLAVELERPAVRVLYRRNSRHNSFLLTERCNHYCLMCSQPPKDINDDWIVDELFQAIPLISPETRSLGFTGGEPTLLGERFLRLVSVMREHLPATALHILSNGRRFVDPQFARAYAAIGHPDAMLGIPIYSASSQTHDHIVQADGAFDETVRGILNLKTCGQKVEIRVVVHQLNYAHLPVLAEFITRNLTFVDHVALMGLEMTGFAKANMDALWIDPVDYRQQLYEAAAVLQDFGLPTSIYNHQLCTIDRRIWPLAAKSISDWKNEYRLECLDCGVRERCGGFFATGRSRLSRHIRPMREN